MLARATRRQSGQILTAALLTLVGCQPPTDVPPTDEPARLSVSANVSATTIATMVVKVSASDIPTPLVFNLQISGGVATGTILIPVGSDRKVELEAYDASHLMTHRGERTISVVSGTTALTIVLDPIVGTQQVNATLGAFTIAVTSGGSSSLSVGGPPLQLTATIMNNASPPQQVSPAGNDLQWASTTPAFFTVSNTGLVTAVRAGTGTVVATYKGFAGSFSITVQ